MDLGVLRPLPGRRSLFLDDGRRSRRQLLTAPARRVFRALYEAYLGADHAPRPAGPPTRGEREVASREHALQLFPIGTTVEKEFADHEGQLKVFGATVFDYCDP